MFADGRGPYKAMVFESRILSSLGIAGGYHQCLAKGGQTDSQHDHIGSLVFGRWLARQYAEHRAGARMFSMREGTIKAGTAANPAGDLLEHPGGAWDFYVDPTAPMDLLLHADDTVHSGTWWALRSMPASGSVADLRVTAPDGVTWIVIDGRFRFLTPPRAASSRPTPRLGRSRWSIESTDDGRPLPGRTRHEVLRVDGATLSPRSAAFETQSPARSRRLRFADSFVLPSDGGEMVSTRSDGNVAPPTADALELLNARWSGDGLDCVDGSGTLVITDPAVGQDAPHAVLVREDALVSALRGTGQQLTIQLEAVNILSRTINTPVTQTIVVEGDIAPIDNT
ncbi:hypothetical protein [Brachybacterium kimchii]|uniref:Uncharacterized protein n=1 Tax=Brachybacterium kimchii TaxID=2942909 RepID=A0ABY4N794_9MICO|nr:hypothetical protein [Brachybacterium kimchii]UQN29224.1 hypothetical protein M4486_16565 [Brachybacterium kimchii]